MCILENGASPARSTGKKSDSDVSHRSKSPSVSRSRSRSPRRRHKYSNSRSRSRSRKYSRSRSRTPPSKSRRRRYSRSRSRSRSPRRHHGFKRRSRRSRSHSPMSSRRRHDGNRVSHSPMSSRRRHDGNRDDPEPTSCLGVFGLSLYTQERELRDTFSRYGSVDQVQIVYDRQSGRSRGFCFIYFNSVDDAIEAKDRCTGIEIDGRRIRVDYSITHRAHTPTPGIYLGKPTEPTTRHRSPSPYKGGYRSRRSPSPYRSRRSRSRSRSYSPRRY